MAELEENKLGSEPNKCTVYVANFSYSLTRNDLHKVFEKVGRIVQ